MPDSMPKRLPEICYEGHPLYANPAKPINLGKRLFALARVAEMVVYVLVMRIRRLNLRSHSGGARNEQCLADLQRDGIFVSRLSPASRRAIVNAASPHFEQLAASRNRIPNGARNYGDNQLDTRRPQAAELHAAIDRALDETGILASIGAYLGCRVKVRKLTLQINDQWDSYWRAHFDKCGLDVPATAFFHVDNTYGVVKAMLYISSVKPEDGPLSYVPGTHRLKVGLIRSVIMRATDIWLDVHPDERDLFLALPRSLRCKAKFGDDIRDGSAWSRWLINHEQAFTSMDGDLLIFDTKGIHRGGMARRGERRVIQVMIS